MNKHLNILISIAVSAFLGANLYLMFSDKTTIPKSIYVDKYERMTIDDFNEKIVKEALVSSLETYTIYVGRDDAVESWLVTEGDTIIAGDELALLNTERADSQRSTWESERNALYRQEDELNNIISNLLSSQSSSTTTSSAYADTNRQNITETIEKTLIDFGVDFDLSVDITQDGSYAQAIAAAEQQLTDISRQLVVLDAQLDQNPDRPALVSPVDGVILEVTRRGSTLAVDISSTQKVVKTYVKDNEWQDVELGDRVILQGDGIGGAAEGSIISVSPTPALNDAELEAYKVLDPESATNPLAYYEVRITTDADLNNVPLGNNVNAHIVTNEALDAVSMNEEWLRGIDDNRIGVMIDKSGKTSTVLVTSPFTSNKRAVVTAGLFKGDIVLNESELREYVGPQTVFLQMPAYMPTKAEWRKHGWQTYVKQFLLN